MSGIIIGTLSKRNSALYSARVGIGAAHYDYLREVDGVAELRFNPDVDSNPLNSVIKPSLLHLEFQESFAVLSAYSAYGYANALSLPVSAIDGSYVTTQLFSIATNRIIYISDRPIVQNMNFPEGSALSTSGGATAGTYILVANKGVNGGTTLYWSADTISTSLDKLGSTNVIEPLEVSSSIARVGSTDFFTAEVVVENDFTQSVASTEIIFDSWSGPDPIPTELEIGAFAYNGLAKVFSIDTLTFDDPNAAVGEKYNIIVFLKDSNGDLIQSIPFEIEVV